MRARDGRLFAARIHCELHTPFPNIEEDGIRRIALSGEHLSPTMEQEDSEASSRTRLDSFSIRFSFSTEFPSILLELKAGSA